MNKQLNGEVTNIFPADFTDHINEIFLFAGCGSECAQVYKEIYIILCCCSGSHFLAGSCPSLSQ